MIVRITTALAISLLAQAQPPIRSRTTLVPVDVRVVDDKGNPLTDLKKEEFVVEENGVPQDVRLFETHAMTAETTPVNAGESGAALLLRRDLVPGTPAIANQRVFLLVLGRGRLQQPARGVDAVIRFVKDRLLPQDRVAVMAWNRSTVFTTDRAATLDTLERFRKGHEQIEADLTQYFSSLRSLYSSGEIPADIQKEIDAVFGGRRAAQRLTAGPVTDAARIRDDQRRAADALTRNDINKERIPGTGVDTTFETAAAELVGMDFDEYAETTLKAGQQISALYSALMYLRQFDGDKHLIFVNEQGLFLPRLEDDKSLAALASDARVSIDTIQTGGIVTMNPLVRPCPPCATTLDPNRVARVSSSQMQQQQTVRTIADLSGGMSSTYGSADDLLTKIDRSTRFQYLLGYMPANPAWDGKYRRITVKVTRKNARVLYRHGYYARETLTPGDRRGFMTYTRIAAAGDALHPIADIKLTSVAAFDRDTREAVLTITLGAEGLKFIDGDGRHKASVQMAIFCGDEKEAIIGEDWPTIDFNLSDESYRRFLTEGASFTKRLPVRGVPKFIKLIAYDYAADRVGTATITLPAK